MKLCSRILFICEYNFLIELTDTVWRQSMKSEDERHRFLVPIVHLLAVKPWESHLIFLSPSI